MHESAVSARTPVHLWIIGVLAVLWNAMGAFDYLATQLRWEFYMSQFTDEQLAYFYGFPAWMDGAWAVAVWGGLLGALLLLARQQLAVVLFALSVVGIIISSIYSFGLSDGAEMMGTGGTIFSAVIIVLAIALLIYAMAMKKRGVLR